jgi:pyridinium-3,5-bisthiocarboxylic acid mononucleotide nickel chelatase
VRHLHIEPFSGVSGDMLLAGLLHLGAPLGEVESALQGSSFPGVRRLRLQTAEISSFGVPGLSLRVEVEPRPEREASAFAEVRAWVEAALPAGRGRERACRTLQTLVEAHACAAQLPPEEVRFHELGGLDTAVDLVGVASALEALGVESLTCGPIPLTRGGLHAHGRTVPTPSAATLELLKGWPTVGLDLEGELVTPTGAALATTLAEAAPSPPMTLLGSGAGFGKSLLPKRPNCLRLYLGEARPRRPEAERLVELAANLDDLSAEILATLPGACLRAGALDAWLTPALMKKGRPGQVLHALCTPGEADAVEEAIFRDSSTLGVRKTEVERRALTRAWEEVSTPWGPVRVKVGTLEGEVVNRAPEFEDCRQLASKEGVPLKDVYAAATGSAGREHSPAPPAGGRNPRGHLEPV